MHLDFFFLVEKNKGLFLKPIIKCCLQMKHSQRLLLIIVLSAFSNYSAPNIYLYILP